MDDIGENLEALVCFTNSGDRGRWLFPNDTVVTNGVVYEGRRDSSISLNRRSGVVVDNGLFRCKIQDAERVTETLYIIGVYDRTSGIEAGLSPRAPSPSQPSLHVGSQRLLPRIPLTFGIWSPSYSGRYPKVNIYCSINQGQRC